MSGQLKQYARIRDQNFLIGITFYNFEKERDVPINNVGCLMIQESLWDWNTVGYLQIQSWAELIERGPGGDGPDKEGFFIRTDLATRLKITFQLCDEKKEDLDIAKPKDAWIRTFDLVVTRVEDVYDTNYSESNDSFAKARRYYFEDERFVRLKYTHIEWSTSQYHPKEPNKPEKVHARRYGEPDERHCMIASDAIQSILLTASSSEQDPEKEPDIKCGTKSWESPKTAQFDLGKINKEEWTDTDEEMSLVKYIAPKNCSAMDAILYILPHCVDKNGFPMMLDPGRTDKERKKGWQLYPLVKVFKNHEDYFSEKFYITDSIFPTKDDKDYDPGADGDELSPKQNSKSRNPSGNKCFKGFWDQEASHIKQYEYSPPGGNVTSRLTNSPVFEYDFRAHKFNFWQSKGDLKANYESIDQYREMGDLIYGGLPISTNYINSKGFNATYTTSPRSYFPPSLARNMMIWDMITNSARITFEVPGVPQRRAGLWFSVNRHSLISRDNWMDKRLQGEWLTTKTVHIFKNNNYTTIMEGTKIDIKKTPPKNKPEETRDVGMH